MNYSRLFFVQPIPYIEERAMRGAATCKCNCKWPTRARLIRDNDGSRWKFRFAVRSPAGRMQLRQLRTRVPAHACDGAWSSERLCVRSRLRSCKLANVNTWSTRSAAYTYIHTEGSGWFIWGITRRPALIVIVNQRNPSPLTECD